MGSFQEKASIPPLNSTDKTALRQSPPTTEREHRERLNTGRQHLTHSTGDLPRPEHQGKIRTQGGGWGVERHARNCHRKRGTIRCYSNYCEAIRQGFNHPPMLILSWCSSSCTGQGIMSISPESCF